MSNDIYEEILNTHVDIWEMYGCPMNGVERAQVRLLFKQGDYSDAMSIIDAHQERMIKSGRMPHIKKIKIDTRLTPTGEIMTAVSDEWDTVGYKADQWAEVDENKLDWIDRDEDGW